MENCTLRARIKEAFSGSSDSGGFGYDGGITRRAGYGDDDGNGGGAEGIFWQHKGSKKVLILKFQCSL